MSPLFFLMTRTFKNKLFRLQSLFVAMIYVLLFWPLGYTFELGSEYLGNIGLYKFVYFNVLVFLFLLVAISTVLTGPVRYAKSDFYYILTSPIAKKNTFLYSIYRRLNPMITLILLMAVSWTYTLRLSLSLSYLQVIGGYVGIVLCVIQSYILCEILIKRVKRKQRIMIPLLMMVSIYYIIIAFSVFEKGINLSFNRYVYFVPIVGWISGVFFNVLFSPDIKWIIWGFGFIILNVVAVVFSFNFIANQDYDNWVDVSINGNSFNVKNSENIPPKGLSGIGVSTIFFKSIREEKNRRNLFWLDWGAMVAVVVIAVLAIGIAQTTYNDNLLPIMFTMLFICFIATFTLDMLPSSNSFVDEIDSPIFKLLPFKWSTKIFWIILYGMLKSSILCLLLLLTVGIFIKATAFQIVMSMMIALSLGFLYSGII